MRSSGTILCAIPAACWSSTSSRHRAVELLQRYLRGLATLERRISKNVAVEDERARYMRLCRQIEDVALGNARPGATRRAFRKTLDEGQFPALRIGSGYVDLLRHLELENSELGPRGGARIGSSVFRPTEIAANARQVESAAKQLGYSRALALRHRQWYLNERVRSSSCGLVEIPEPLGCSILSDEDMAPGAEDGRDLIQRIRAWFRRRWRKEVAPPSDESLRRSQRGSASTFPASDDWRRYGGTEDRGEFMEQRLRDQVTSAIAGSGAVNLTNQRHKMATTILQEFIHLDPQHPACHVPVAYGDGTDVAPFPVRCVAPLPATWTATKEFHVALVSMRHLPIDAYIDFNWYRNAEVPSRHGLSHADAHCFDESKRRLAQLLRANIGERVLIHLYHTGYMPAVVGFYRALVTHLASGEFPHGCLQVIPRPQPREDDEGFEASLPWPCSE